MALSGMDELDRMTPLETMLYYNYQSKKSKNSLYQTANYVHYNFQVQI